jgi:DNA-directed RNA polymerase subunit RPC12/RpoP
MIFQRPGYSYLNPASCILHPGEGRAMTEQYITCAFCGHRFKEEERSVTCTRCSLLGTGGCRKIRCPQCEYEMPAAPRLPGLVAKLLKKARGTKIESPE